MNRSRYLDQKSEALDLKDHLAIERTAMASERTLLAYVRTMIGLIALGGTFLKLFSDAVYHYIGWSLMILGICLIVIGFIRYARIEIILSAIENDGNFRDKGDKFHQLFWILTKKLNLLPVNVK